MPYSYPLFLPVGLLMANLTIIDSPSHKSAIRERGRSSSFITSRRPLYPLCAASKCTRPMPSL